MGRLWPWHCSRAVAHAQTGAATTNAKPWAWSPEVREALAAYHAGRYDKAQQHCLRVLTGQGAARGRHDAALIQALCLLRMPARADRVEGQARLTQLADEDPALWDEPECALAYGIGLTGLAETAAALDTLERAAEGFAAQGRPDRQLAALVALAKTWARHTEWEVTPARFDVRRPAVGSEADAIRRTQIEAVRARVTVLPGHEEALAGVDLVLAKHSIKIGEADEGRAILARLAAAPVLTPPCLEAALLEADACGEAERWEAALALYERVRREDRGDWARRAEERVLELTRPQVLVDGPAVVRCGRPAPVQLRVRGMDTVQLEVRRVNLAEWLETSSRRGNEAFLPESGSVQMVRELETRGPSSYAWWDSGELESPLEFTAQPGAYVVVVRGREPDGRERTEKRLVVVSDLSATCFVGAEYVTVWAVLQTGSSAGEPAAKFWMQHSFTPTEPAFEAGVARFPLPNEARIMRDKRWVCLVRWGEHVAICRGRLLGPRAAGLTPLVAMVGGPPTPQAGETLYVSGQVLGGKREPSGPDTGGELQLQITDILERPVFSRNVTLSAGGAFSAEFPLTAAQAGKHLRVLSRYQGRVLENVAGRLWVNVPKAEVAGFRVRCEVPEWIQAPTGVINGCVRAEYPWGMWPRGARVECMLHAVRLPTEDSNDEPRFVGSLVREGRLDDQGRFAFALSTGEFGVSGVPLAISVEGHVRSRARREGVGYAEVLLSMRRPWAWLTYEPNEPEAGRPIRFGVDWFEPGGLAVSTPAEVEVSRRGETLARLRLHPGRHGLESEGWLPPEPGGYEIVATIPLVVAEPVQIRKTVAIGPAKDGSAADTEKLRCTAHFARLEDRVGVRVRLEGESAGPLLVLLEAGDPLAAIEIEHLAGESDLFLPLEVEPAAGMRVLVVGAVGSSTELLCAEEVAPDPREVPTLTLTAPTKEVWPGTMAQVDVLCEEFASLPRGTTLTARLINAASSGHTDGQRGSRWSEPASVVPGLTIVSSNEEPRASARAVFRTPNWRKSAHGHLDLKGDAEQSVPAALRSVLFEGMTLWSTSLEVVTETTELPVPLPTTPGLYRLIVAVRTPPGAVATEALILDARRGVRLGLEMPQRLTLGDRTIVAALVENGYSEPVEVQVWVRGGGGLHIEALRVVEPERQTLDYQAGTPAIVHLPAGGRTWLHVDVEAARVGDGKVEVEVAARAARRSAACGYEILPATEPAVKGVGVRIERKLFRWRPVGDWVPFDDENEFERRYWDTVPWSGEDRLRPGELVQVREMFVLTEAQAEFVWLQRVPATCHAAPAKAQLGEPIGSRVGDRGDALAYRVTALGPGRHEHEYFLTVVRPGSCLLPLPEWRIGETRIPLVVEPDEVRLIVLEGE
ncbi:MAG: hypothetical protein KAY37_11410 [Phycisphaerae bacterium]|nr:hypothetical protein [Phycisphaerae bacterium]